MRNLKNTMSNIITVIMQYFNMHLILDVTCCLLYLLYISEFTLTI